MRIVIALGGNALLRRGEEMSSDNQRSNVREACERIAPLASAHELVISHGNGPQVGLLALQGEAYHQVPPYPLDILGAETQGMIGYLVEQEIGNLVPVDKAVACLLTMIEVDPDDPAFAEPTKPIGPFYTPEQAVELERVHDWTFAVEGDTSRRVVASPRPKRIIELRQIQWMLEHGAVVICAGGGGIPTVYDNEHRLRGVEAVIDKDHASALLASTLDADVYVMATDTDAVYLDWGTPSARPILRAHPDALRPLLDTFEAGSMRPKAEAACDFARVPGRRAVIGAPRDLQDLVDGRRGTTVSTDVDDIELGPPQSE